MSNTSPKFTVIISCYNVAEYIDICMEHLLHQTIGFKNIEIILIDDMSSDDKTLTKLKNYESLYSDNIILIINEEKLGPGGSRNVALPYATGEYIAYCDGDDWFSYDAFEHLYHMAITTQSDVVEFSHTITFEHNGNCISHDISDINYSVTEISTLEARKQFILPSDSTVVCWDKIYKRELVQANNIKFREFTFYEEPPFSYMVRYFSKRYCKISAPLYYYYQRPNSSSTTFRNRRNDMSLAYNTLLEDFKNREIYNVLYEEIDFIYWCGYFYLPLLNMAAHELFYTLDEIIKLQQTLQASIHDIRNNKYFLENFSSLPVLGDLVYTDLRQINIHDVYELFYTLSH